MNIRAIRWINTITFALMVIVNILANAIPLGIGDTGYIAQKYPSLFTPSVYTFGIWAVIYILLIVYILFQWGIFDDRTEKTVEALGPMFAVSCLLNMAWIFAWHFDVIWLSMLIMLALMTTLIRITQILADVPRVGVLRGAVDVVFDIYFGWIIAATLANASVFLVSIGWRGFGISDEVWTCALLIVGAVIGTMPTIMKGKYFSTLAVMWAYFGILARHLGEAGTNGEHTGIIVCSGIGIVMMMVVMIFMLAKRKEGETSNERRYANT